ncbi:glycosyltransferase family 4 protein [Niveibacterium sp.]|uniref:glycosyltransferase family 4 protein n=1 Tax=Niveibacterium sp. TaxID=2017444 RepID=UPI0035AFC89F
MKVLALTRYAALGASSRLRFHQYFPALEAAGIHVEARHLFDDGYVKRLYSGRGRSPGALLHAYSARLVDALNAARFDRLWLEKELFPGLPALCERVLAGLGVPILVDFDDAVFHSYDRHPNAIYRRLMGRKIDVVMRASRLVVAGSPYLAERAQMAGARRVESLPTVIDLQRYPAEAAPTNTEIPTIGWIGSPSTVQYLEGLRAPLNALRRERNFRLVVIGARLPWVAEIGGECLPWSEDTELQALRQIDIGVMPLPDDPWERGKCGYKLIQYMACSRPVVASPVGANLSIVQPGDNGFLAADSSQWQEALGALIDDAALRRRIGASGRAKVEAQYCVQRTAPRLIGWMQELGSR